MLKLVLRLSACVVFLVPSACRFCLGAVAAVVFCVDVGLYVNFVMGSVCLCILSSGCVCGSIKSWGLACW